MKRKNSVRVTEEKCVTQTSQKSSKNINKGKGAKRSNPNWEKQLDKLIEWAFVNKNFLVFFKKTEQDWVDFHKREIVISTKHKPEVAFYCLLHELGHVLLIENKKEYRHSYETIWKSFSTNSLTLRVTTLQEELDAWREGFKLGKSLKMRIERRKFEIVKSRCIATYLPWTVKCSAFRDLC